MENIPTIGCNTSPATNINFISPPPKLSFLNIKLPKSMIMYIKINNKSPPPRDFNNVEIPPSMNFIIKIRLLEMINTESGIIK